MAAGVEQEMLEVIFVPAENRFLEIRRAPWVITVPAESRLIEADENAD